MESVLPAIARTGASGFAVMIARKLRALDLDHSAVADAAASAAP
jgi:hypothetical protein